MSRHFTQNHKVNLIIAVEEKSGNHQIQSPWMSGPNNVQIHLVFVAVFQWQTDITIHIEMSLAWPIHVEWPSFYFHLALTEVSLRKTMWYSTELRKKNSKWTISLDFLNFFCQILKFCYRARQITKSGSVSGRFIDVECPVGTDLVICRWKDVKTIINAVKR